MPKNALTIVVLSSLLPLLLCGYIGFSKPLQAQPPVAAKGNGSGATQISRLIHRRFLRIPTTSNAERQVLTISVAGREVERFEASLATSSPESFLEIDMTRWLGTVAVLESQSGPKTDGEKLFALVGQSNQPLAALVESTSSSDPIDTTEQRATGLGDQKISFAFDIQPLLSEKCFACHGPDAHNAESDLKLSDRESAIEFDAFVVGDSANSVAIERIVSADQDLLMPPPESHKTPLTQSEVDLLKRWIDQGAQYETHWAFARLQPAVDPSLGSKTDGRDSVVRNPIDSFVHRKLAKVGLLPNADEAPHRLIRRLSFDLVGLPPEPEMVKRFLESPTEAVYQEIVDDLLASHHYGEHWTLHWLDSVRYADTHGIHIDNRRAIWPYRDWVINAFNSNQPFDQFTVEQIAGDMLPAATRSQKVASGYNRCLPTTSEGGVIDAEVAVNNANDQTASTFAVWQGLTVGCAACHDHKFDPISQKEYYQLTAFFRNNEMKAKDGNVNAPPPVMPVPSLAQAAQQAALEEERDEIAMSLRAELKQWRAAFKDVAADAIVAKLSPAEDAGIQSLGETFKYIPSPADVEFGDEKVETKLGLFGPTPVINKQQFIRRADAAPVGSSRSFSCGGFLRIERGTTGTIWSKMFADDQIGWELALDWKGQAIVRVVNDPQQKLLDITTDLKIADGKWHHVFVVMDDKRADDPLSIYVDGVAQTYRSRSALGLPKTASFATEAKVVFGRRDDRGKGGNVAAIKKGQVLIGDFYLFDDVVTAVEVRSLQVASISRIGSTIQSVSKLDAEATKKLNDITPDDKDSPDPKKQQAFKDAKLAKTQIDDLKATQRRLLLHRLLEIEKPKIAQRLSRQAGIEAKLAKLKHQVPVTLVMKELKNSTPKAYVLDRGDYASPREEVSADVPAVLPAFKQGAPKDRLGLAGWIVSPENPLTARVTVNRYWYYLFGAGIVESTEDFGVTGSRPSHPELLNWLAADFVENDWDLKRLLRTIVTSSTYRQSQTITADKLNQDPHNRLLSRGPRVRLDGEQLRDMALVNSGLLVDKLGGPPVKPYQPDKIWQEVAMAQSDTRYYRADSGDGLYRRSLYTFWKRTAAPPTMTIMNSPDRDVFCVRRERTNTPLQAFVMWNDPQFVEAAKKVAERLVKDGGNFNQSASDIGQSFLARSFSDEEIELLKATFDAALEAFENEPEKADALLDEGNSKINDELDAAAVAAWTVVVSQVMNLDEALMK